MTDMNSGTAAPTGLADSTAASTVGDGVASHRAYGNTTTTGSHGRRLSTETKAAYKTSELWIFVAAVAGVLVASDLVGTTASHSDYFRADRAWLYIVILTVGYLVSRGIAKAGSRDHYDA